jgi:hypothetical protein
LNVGLAQGRVEQGDFVNLSAHGLTVVEAITADVDRRNGAVGDGRRITGSWPSGSALNGTDISSIHAFVRG